MRRTCLIAISVVLVAGSVARAQPAAPGTVAPAPAARPDGRSASAARTMSVALTVTSMAVGAAIMREHGGPEGGGAVIFVGGAVLGPATGLWYAGRPGGVGIALRTTLVFVGLQLYLAHDEHFDPCSSFDPDCDFDAERRAYDRERLMLKGLMVAAAAGLVTSVYYDARKAGRIIDRRNAPVVAPTVLPARDGPAPGLSLSGRF